MKTVIAVLIVLGSLSASAQSTKKPSCESIVVEQIMRTKGVTEKLVDLLSDSDFSAVEDIQNSSKELAKLVCKK